MKTTAIHALYALRVFHQLGGCARPEYIRRAARIACRFGLRLNQNRC